MDQIGKSTLRNFRSVGPLQSTLGTRTGNCTASCNHQTRGNLYRSASVEDADESTVEYLKNQLQVKTIIDLRNATPVRSVVASVYKPVSLAEYLLEKQQTGTEQSTGQFHVMLPIINRNYFKQVVKRQPYSAYPRIFMWLFRYLVLHDASAFRYLGEQTVKPYGIKQTYFDFLTGSQHVVKHVMEILSEPQNVPALICCRHGKDRTGVMAALILHVLGYSIEEICDDYHQSEAELQGMRDRLVLELELEFGLDESFVTADKETMLQVFSWLQETYGSVNAYLTSAGVDENLQTRVRSTLETKLTHTESS